MKELRKTWISKFQDYHILVWTNCRVPAFESWFKKSRTTRTDMLFNETYNRVNHLILFSPESKQMIHESGNIELCELLDTEPKTQCKVCLSYWDVGIVYCTCGQFLRKGTEENKKYVQYTMDLLSIPRYYIKKGRPRAPLREEARGHRVLHRELAQEKMQKISSTWVSTTGSSETRSSARTWLTPVELKKFVAKWMTLRTKTTPTRRNWRLPS